MKKYSRSPVICHYGIKGMKWGVRRYQNADGTLTDEGKKRYFTQDMFGRTVLSKAGAKEAAVYAKVMDDDIAKLVKELNANTPAIEALETIARAQKAKGDKILEIARKEFDRLGINENDIDDVTRKRIVDRAVEEAKKTKEWKNADDASDKIPALVNNLVKEIVGEEVYNEPLPELLTVVGAKSTVGAQYVSVLTQSAYTSVNKFIDALYEYEG